jgi:hypothetical protein
MQTPALARRDERDKSLGTRLPIRNRSHGPVLTSGNGELGRLLLRGAGVHLQREQRQGDACKNHLPKLAINAHAVILRRIHHQKG